MTWKEIIKAPPIPNPATWQNDSSRLQEYPNNDLGEAQVVMLFEKVIDPILEESASKRRLWADIPVRSLGMDDDVAVKWVQKLYIDAFEGRDAYEEAALRGSNDGPIVRIKLKNEALDNEAMGRKERTDFYYGNN